MRQPPVGANGMSPSAGESAEDTRLQTGLPHASDDNPPATVARKSPRP